MTSHDQSFVQEIRVYYADTDAGGIVYHARYLEFAERCRSEILREVGHPLMASNGNQFVVRKSQIEWLAPARLDDLLVCRTSVGQAGGARVQMKHRMFLSGALIASIDIELAYVSSRQRPTRLPPGLVAAMLNFTDGSVPATSARLSAPTD